MDVMMVSHNILQFSGREDMMKMNFFPLPNATAAKTPNFQRLWNKTHFLFYSRQHQLPESIIKLAMYTYTHIGVMYVYINIVYVHIYIAYINVNAYVHTYLCVYECVCVCRIIPDFSRIVGQAFTALWQSFSQIPG